jgi:hypothetical protein
VLIYPIQFDHDPMVNVDRILALVADPRRNATSNTLHDYLPAIRAGLASSEPLSELIPQSHSEAVIRSYLQALEQRISSSKLES